jgi:hypothetical protein
MHFVEYLAVAFERVVSCCGSSGQAALAGLCFAVLGKGCLKRNAAGRAERIRAVRLALYSEPHVYGPVRASDFHWLDEGYYSDMERRLDAMSFRCFGDVEDLTLSAIFPEMRTGIREFVSDDGVLAVSVWQVKVPGWRRLLGHLGTMKRDVRIVDLGTEFSDGTFVATANNPGLDSNIDVPGIERMRLPNETAIEEMVATHRRRVGDFLAAHPGAQPVSVRTAREFRQSVSRAHELICARLGGGRSADSEQFAGVAMTGGWTHKKAPGGGARQMNQAATSGI